MRSAGGDRRTVHVRNGYSFETDRLDRTRGGEGDLHLGRGSSRSRRAQRQAGGPDRRVGDDGGYYIAHRFNGPADGFNHFAQNAQFSRGAYRALEDSWARALREGKSVHVRITPDYVGASRRPSSITVEWTVNGAPYKRTFPN